MANCLHCGCDIRETKTFCDRQCKELYAKEHEKEPRTHRDDMEDMLHGLDILASGDPSLAVQMNEVKDELFRAIAKFPEWPDDATHAAAIVAEESGELTKAALQYTFGGIGHGKDEMRAEAIQIAAMALRFLVNLDERIWA